MAAKKNDPKPKSVQTAEAILGVEAALWREHADEDGNLIKITVITGQGQKFSFTSEELTRPEATRNNFKARKIKVFKGLPHGPVRAPQEET